MKKIIFGALLLIVCLVSNAQNTDSSVTGKIYKAPWFVERYKVSAGLFVPVNNTNIRVGVNNGNAGTDIDFERDLGFKTSSLTFLGDFQWRLTRRSRLDFSYFNVHRSSTKTLDKDITFGDSTYNVNTSVYAKFSNNIIRVSYGYALFEKPKFEAGLLIGAHIVGNKANLGISGNNIDAEAGTDFNFTAPLPDFGIWGGYAFSNRFAVNFEADYLSLTINDISGRIIAYNLAFSYRILPNLHASLGYTGLNFKVDAEKKHLNGHFRWGYNGPALTAAYTFGKKYWAH